MGWEQRLAADPAQTPAAQLPAFVSLSELQLPLREVGVCHLVRGAATRRRLVGGALTRLERIVAVQSPSCVRLFSTPRAAARRASLSLTITCSLLKFMSLFTL